MNNRPQKLTIGEILVVFLMGIIITAFVLIPAILATGCASNIADRAGMSFYRQSVVPIAIQATETAIAAQDALRAVKDSGIYDPSLRAQIDDALTTPMTQAMLDTIRRTQSRMDAAEGVK